MRNKIIELYRYIVRRTFFWIGFLIRPPVHWFIGLFSTVGDPAVFDKETFPWVQELEANWEKIRDEAMSVLEHRAVIPPLRELSPDHDRIAVDNKWQSFFLWGYGFKLGRNAEICPVTTRLVEQIPGLLSAFYSIHAPRLHIPRHYGVTKGMITCHLGLQVPRERERCRISIDEKIHTWNEGKCLIFDDTRYHEVWNDTDEDRIILLLQFARPLAQPGKGLADGIMWVARRSPFIQTTVRQLDAWEARFDESIEDAHKRSQNGGGVEVGSGTA